MLGYKEKWQGWKWRIEKYVEALKKCHDKELVIFMDAYDVIAATDKSPTDFESAFYSFKRKIVVGCEWYCGNSKNCGNVEAWWKNHKIKKPPFRKHVNAGGVAGYAKYLLKMYSWILNENFEDDQLGVSQWINQPKNIKKVALDFGSNLFYNAHILDGLRAPMSPFFYHFPGPLLKLGLMPSYNIRAQQHLKEYARKLYPSLLLEFSILFFFLSFVVFFFFKTKHEINL